MASLGSLTLDFIANTGPFDRKVKGATKTVNAFEAGLKKMGKESAKARAEAKKSSTAFGRFQAKLALGGKVIGRSFVGAISNATTAVARLGVKLAAVGAGSFVAFSVFALKSAADMEQTTLSFEVMLNSARKADKLVRDLQKFSTKTPFTPEEAFGAGRQLLATGFDETQILGNLRSIGDVAAGTGNRLGDLVNIFAEIKAKGKADLQDLRQFARRGIPVFDELRKVTGKSKLELSDFVSKGGVNLGHMQAAFANLTSEGGRFFGMMEAQSKTTGGLWSTFVGELKMGVNEFGAMLDKQIDLKTILREMTKLVGEMDWKALADGATKAFDTVLNSIGPVFSALAQMQEMAFSITAKGFRRQESQHLKRAEWYAEGSYNRFRHKEIAFTAGKRAEFAEEGAAGLKMAREAIGAAMKRIQSERRPQRERLEGEAPGKGPVLPAKSLRTSLSSAVGRNLPGYDNIEMFGRAFGNAAVDAIKSTGAGRGLIGTGEELLSASARAARAANKGNLRGRSLSGDLLQAGFGAKGVGAAIQTGEIKEVVEAIESMTSSVVKAIMEQGKIEVARSS